MLNNVDAVRFIAELLSTALLVFLGCIGCVITEHNTAIQASINFGLTILMITHVFGFISGAFANPVVTVTAFVLNYTTFSRAMYYLAAQYVGALIGYGLMILALPTNWIYDEKPGLCVTTPNPDIGWKQAFFIEFGLTCIMLFGYCAIWDFRNNLTEASAICLGLLYTACSFCGGYYTGCSLNPARTFSAAYFHNHFDGIGIYFLSQYLAAFVVGFSWRIMYTVSYRVNFRPSTSY